MGVDLSKLNLPAMGKKNSKGHGKSHNKKKKIKKIEKRLLKTIEIGFELK